MLTHTASSPFPGSPQPGRTAFFPAADAAGFTENAALPLRVGRSDTCSAAPFYQPLFYIDPLIGLRLIGVLAVRYTLRPRYPPATGKPTIEVLPVRYRRNQLGRYCKTEKCRGVFQNGEKVGLLHEAAEFNTLILSGCTSVHPNAVYLRAVIWLFGSLSV